MGPGRTLRRVGDLWPPRGLRDDAPVLRNRLLRGSRRNKPPAQYSSNLDYVISSPKQVSAIQTVLNFPPQPAQRWQSSRGTRTARATGLGAIPELHFLDSAW